ncbi:MAG TPA: transcriptional regulator NrdR [Holosporales bacterium]|nr:transcriptional regulator NrdR [Holosporales bacterium]
MKCPFCANPTTSVKDSRSADDNVTIRRRRVCAECQGRFSTVEHVQLLTLKVKKKSGVVESFRREKLENALQTSLHKRPIEEDRIEKVINGIIRRLEVMGDIEIPSTTIGEIVMETLHDLDTVAYVRFASVYRNFHEASDFKQFVREIKKDTK